MMLECCQQFLSSGSVFVPKGSTPNLTLKLRIIDMLVVLTWKDEVPSQFDVNALGDYLFKQANLKPFIFVGLVEFSQVKVSMLFRIQTL